MGTLAIVQMQNIFGHLSGDKTRPQTPGYHRLPHGFTPHQDVTTLMEIPSIIVTRYLAEPIGDSQVK
tara:strand:+ start:385 stop:585 length:201 start_codon:yes stop_codon:yes gene_type:complete